MDHQDKDRPPAPAGPYPWLVYSHREGQTYFNIADPMKPERRRIPELLNKRCLASSHGWCVFSDANKICSCFFLWNPLTSEKIDLPKLHYCQDISQCVLSSSPKETNCRILLFPRESHWITSLKLGDAEWKELGCNPEMPFLCNPIICNGKLYAESSGSNSMFLVDGIDEGRIVLTCLNIDPPRLVNDSFPIFSYFVESNGEIYQIHLIPNGCSMNEIVTRVEVFRLDFSRMVWVKVYTLKNSVFCLHHSYSISYPAINSDEIKGNQLFVISDKIENLYSYNLQDGCLSLISKPSSDLAFWVMSHPRMSRTKEEAENHECTKEDVCFSRLPLQITSLITRRLNLVHYLNLGATCRFLRSILTIKQQKLSMNELENHSLSPWLMFFEKDNSICTFLEPKHGDKYYLKLPQELVGYQIRYAIDGWLLMSGGRNFDYIYNPFTGVFLPFRNGVRKNFDIVYTCFSISPTSMGWIVVDIFNYSHDNMLVSFGSNGDTKWSIRVDIGIRFDFWGNNTPVFCNDAFYFLSQTGKLGTLQLATDTTDRKVTWNVHPSLDCPCGEYNQSFLVDRDGELLAVFVGRFGKWVQVFKLDQSKTLWSWIKVDSLNNYMIFVSRSSSFSAIADSPGMENKIYFPRFHGHNIVYYDFNTKQFHSFDQKDSPVVDFCKAREQLYCVWIEPKPGLTKNEVVCNKKDFKRKWRTEQKEEEGLRSA